MENVLLNLYELIQIIIKFDQVVRANTKNI